MKRRRISSSILLLVLLTSTLAASRSQTNTIVLPRETEASFGNGSESPFFHGYFEQIYAAAEFSDLPIDAILITDIAFRIDENEDRLTNFFGYDVVLDLNVFRGPLGQILTNKSGRQEPITTVFVEDEVGLPGVPGELQFRLRFRLQQPFLYDRRAGHLVLTIDSAGGGGVIDAEAVVGDRGFNIYFGGQGYIFQQQMLVTEFSYAIPPKIGTIRRLGDFIQIIFSHSCAPESIRVESSTNVKGPFTVVESVTFDQFSGCSMRANIPFSAEKTFFRIRQNLPLVSGTTGREKQVKT